MLDVFSACQTRERIAGNDALAVSLLARVVRATDPAAADELLARPPGGDDLVRQVDDALDALAALTDSLAKVENPSEDEAAQLAAMRKAGGLAGPLHGWKSERPKLLAQLEQQRARLRERLSERVVFVGSIATGAADFVSSSLDAQCPGVYLHGATFNAVMTGEFLRTAPRWTSVAATVAVGLLTTVAIALLSPPTALAAVLLLAGGYAALNGVVLFDRHNLIVGAAGPLVAAGVVWSGVTLIQFVREIGERARLTKRFSSYVDPTLVNYVIENPEQIRLEAHEKELTVCFTDLAGFTTLSEKLRAQSAKLLGQYMETMVPLIRARRGYVNKFLGDGIMFFFGAPVDNADHAADAVGAVLDMQRALVPFNVRLTEQGLPTLAMRTGLSTGMMVVGDAGPSFASDYTVLGDAVNLAARLESANKAFGTTNLITGRTAELLGGRYVVRPIADLLVVGKEQSVFVHEAIAPAESATDGQKRLAALTAEMVSCFAAGRFDDCLRAAAELDKEFGPSKLTARYTEEAEAHRRQPPDPAFRGQIRLMAK
jgi:adenylate cyclase